MIITLNPSLRNTMKTILVVDDSMMTRMMLTTIIKEHYPDWTIIQAKDADDALEKVIDLDFDFDL